MLEKLKDYLLVPGFSPAEKVLYYAAYGLSLTVLIITLWTITKHPLIKYIATLCQPDIPHYLDPER